MGGDFAAGSGEAAGVQLQYAGGSVSEPPGLSRRSYGKAAGINPAARRGTMPNQLLDTFGRVHNNLRISVTDRCNLRCSYCMDEDVTFMDKSELLTFEEITRFVQVAVPLGVDKVRLTGGEPLMRKGLTHLVRMLCAIPGLRDVG